MRMAGSQVRSLAATATAMILLGCLGRLAGPAIGAPAVAAEPEPAVESEPAAGPTFQESIAPILQAHCIKCHGGEATEAGLDLRRHATLVAGGDSGPALVPGQPDESLIMKRVLAGEMPPEDEPPLDEPQRSLLRRWIAAGAPAGGDEAPLEAADPVPRVSDEDRAFWAFQCPVRPPIPQVRAQDRVRTPIDALLLARLEEQGLSLNADAPKLVLLRRLCYDLLGLPPTLEQMDEFLNDERPQAYERLVDRLLASAHYGERWGRHWLDVAGYADSDGYLAADRLRPEAWRYRDYVIRAHNEDRSYDRFIQEQLAGDELVDWRRAEELTPEMVDSLVATGFLRTASDPTYPGYTEPNEIHQIVSDTMQIVSSALVGLTIQCARCHAHKFDPISQRDYYALTSIFLTSYDPGRWQPSETRGIPLAPEAQQARIDEQNQQVEQRVGVLSGTLAELTGRYRKKYVAEQLSSLSGAGDAPTSAIEPALTDQLIAALVVDAAARTDEQKQLVAKHAPTIDASEANLAASFPEYKDEADKLTAAIAAETALRKQLVLVRGLADLEGEPPQGHVLVRGDYEKPGAAVEPGVPEVLAPAGFEFRPQPGYRTSGRRQALADWLTDPAHPLTARTQVNRMWAHHFGRGLVSTPANFGRSGSPPSHPELLDWLATEFVRQGWSMKAMHRLMVTSTAYRQSSDYDEAKAAIDPDNVLLWSWQPRRHEGEVLRDSVLAVAGKLNPEMFGPPAPVTPQPDGSVITADDAQGNRRSVYLIVRRSQHLTMLDLFDTPLMEVNCPQRNESIVPTQALALMNGPFTEGAAAALAKRIVQAAAGDDARIDYAYRLLLTRTPSLAERQAIVSFLDAFEREQRATTIQACSVSETGPAGDQQQAAATDRDREAARNAGWTHVALILLNTSEFVYVH